VPVPAPDPGDGPAELEAKADILADQARRLEAEAAALGRVAGQVRTRQLLRRRAGQLERDPFVGLEASKRTVVITTGTKAAGQESTDSKSPTNGPARGSDDVGQQTDGREEAGPPSSPLGPQAVGGGAAAGAGTKGPGSENSGTGGPTSTPRPTAPSPVLPPSTSFSVQLKAWLDPQTLTEIQRLEQTGQPGARAEALERAAAALRSKSKALESQSQSLRARSRP
jgi:hypothetical protein